MNASRLIPLLVLTLPLSAPAAAPNLSAVHDPAAWHVSNRAATVSDDGGRAVVHLDAGNGDGVAWLVGSDFATGTIAVDLRGRNQPGASFVGLAFNGADDATFEGVYVRPFNFRSDDPARRAHSVQYISMPDHDWSRLRREHPGVYESALEPAPEPEAWLHLRLEIDATQVRVFVNDATTPCLTVTRLPTRPSGRIGLWVGNGSVGDFAALLVTPAGPQ